MASSQINNAYRIIMRERHFELANVSVHELNPTRPHLQTRMSTDYKILNSPRSRESSITLGSLSSHSRQSSFESVTTAPSTSRFSMRYTSTSCDNLTSPLYPRTPPPQSISNVLESHYFRTQGEVPSNLPSRRNSDSPVENKPDLPRRSTDGSSL